MRHRVAVALPPADAVADAAIRRARSLRRRQAATGAFAVVVVAMAVGVVLLRPGPTGAPPAPPVIAQSPPEQATPRVAVESPPPDSEPPAELPTDVQQELQTNRSLPVDVVVADRLLTSAGRAVDLTGVGRVAEAYQVASGWLVLSSRDGGDSLWYVAKARPPRQLLKKVAAIVVAAAGDRVAWRDAERVYISRLLRNRLTAIRGTRVPADARPVGFVGDGVLIERRSPEEVVGSYALWWPARGALSARWRLATGVYGAMPDHRRVVAQLPGGEEGAPCLALLDALADLAVIEQRCDLPLTAGAVGWVSPDGRWLVAERTAAESILIDVSSVFGGDKPAVAEGPRPNGPGAWTGGDTLVYGGTGYLARLRLDRAAAGEPDAVERITVQGGDHRPVLAVPRLS